MSDNKSTFEKDSEQIQDILNRLKASIDKYEEENPSDIDSESKEKDKEEKDELDFEAFFAEFQSEAESEAKAETEPDETEDEPEAEPEIEAEIEPEDEIEEELEEEPEAELEAESEAESEADTEDENEIELEAEPEVEAEIEPDEIEDEEEPETDLEAESDETEDEPEDEIEDGFEEIKEFFKGRKTEATEEQKNEENEEEETKNFKAFPMEASVDNTVDISTILPIYYEKNSENDKSSHKSRAFRITLKKRALADGGKSPYSEEKEESDYGFLESFFDAKRKEAPEDEATKEITFEEMGDPEMPTEIFMSQNENGKKGFSEEKPHFVHFESDTEESEEKENEENIEIDVSEYHIQDEDESGKTHSTSKEEYVSRNQVEKITADYARDLLKSKIKIITAAFLALVLLVLENAIWFGVDLQKLLHISGSSVYAMLDLQIFIIISAIAYVEFYHGARGIFKKKIIPESFLCCIFLVTVIYNVALCIEGENYGFMYSFPSSFLILMCLISKHVELEGEAATFSSVCSQGDKLVADIIPESEVAQSVKDSFTGKDGKIGVMRIKKVGFVDGYFERISKKCHDYKLNSALLSASVAFSLVMGVAVMLLQKELSALKFLSALLSSLLLSTSVSVFFSHIWPVYVLEKKASDAGCAVIGESSINQYANVSVISFEDVEAFPTKKTRISGIKIFNDARPDEVFFYISSIFALVGGPLCGIFREAFAELGISDNVKLTEATQNGMTATVDGREFRIGKGAYMEKNGITLFYDSDDEKQLEKGNVSAMFVSEGDELRAKFYIEYNMSARFAKNASRLNDNNILSVIRSYDPNIDNHLVEKVSCLDNSFVTVVKKGENQIYDYAQLRVNSGLVTGTISKEIIRMVFNCIKTVRIIETGKKVKVITAAFGMLLALISVITNAILYLPSVTMVLISLLTLMPILILGRTNFK